MSDQKTEWKSDVLQILVTGANGYIGSEVAMTLRREGHTVYGLIRQNDQRKELEKHEIIPVVSSMEDICKETELLSKCDVIVDTVIVNGLKVPFSINRDLMNEFAKLAKSTGTRKRYIYTSGVLVYGDYPGVEVDEDETKYPLKGMNKPRIAFEKEVQAFKDLSAMVGVVVRPAWVYGGAGGHYLNDFWKLNGDGKLELVGNPNKYWSWVHLNDLANAFVVIATAASDRVAGEIFNVADGSKATYHQVREAMAKAMHALDNNTKLEIVEKPVDKQNVWQVLCEYEIFMSSKKLQTQLGWKPKQQFLKNVSLYSKSFKAAHN